MTLVAEHHDESSPPAAEHDTALFADEQASANISKPWAHLVLIAFVIAVTSVSFHAVVFGDAVFPWDFQGRMTAGPTYVAANVENGNWPSWNPYQGSGAPMATDIGAGLYYPLHWVVGLLGVPLTVRLQSVLQVAHVVLGGVGIAALARSLSDRSSNQPAQMAQMTLAAAPFVLWGGFYGQASHMHHVRGFAFLPIVLWTVTPSHGRFGYKLALTPLLFYLIASGAYPGQLVPFAGAVAIYSLGFWVRRRDRRQLLMLAVAGLASVAAVATVLYPYVQSNDLLYRAVDPTADRLSRGSYTMGDLLGFYLNPNSDITEWTWLVVPSVLGMALITGRQLRQALPLALVAVFGALAIAVPSLPGFERLVQSGPVAVFYQSRFVAADYKILLVVPVVVLSAQAWTRWITSPSMPGLLRLVALAVILQFGAVWTVDDLTRPRSSLVLLLVSLAIVTGGAAVHLARRNGQLRLPGPVAGMMIIVLLAGMGLDTVRLQQAGRWETGMPVNPWHSEAEMSQRLQWENALARELARTTASRPARVEPTPTDRPQGVPADALGFIRPSYNMGSYGGHILLGRRTAYSIPALYRFLSQPSGFLALACPDPSCDRVSPSTTDVVSDWSALRPESGIRVVAYGQEHIDYEVDLSRTAVVIENEIAFPGWRSNDERARLVDSELPLRVWRIEPGSYRFTARFHSIHKPVQIALAVAAMAASAVLALMAWRLEP